MGEATPNGFQAAHKRVVIRYKARFDQQLAGALRDAEIGFVKGAGFMGQPQQDEWIRASEAVAMLKPMLTDYPARLRILRTRTRRLNPRSRGTISSCRTHIT
jgi:hypothetical protein